jgi:hypothetical protein
MGLLFCVLSCGKTETLDTQNKREDSILSQVFGFKNSTLPAFSPSTSNYIATWPVFDDVTSEVLAINGAPLKMIQERSAILVSRMDSLTKKIPDTLRTQPISSRVMVAKTRAAMVNQEANKGTLDSVAMQQAILEMNTAMANLIVQINEKFEKDREDNKVKDNEKKEMELRKARLDSIYKAELKDEKK